MLANFFSSFCILLFVLTTNTIKTSGNLEPTQIELNSLKQGFKVDSMFSSDIPNSMLFDSNVYYDDSFGDK